MNDALRTIAFMILFGLGVGSLSLASLVDDIDTYYQQRCLMVQAEKDIAALRELNANYDGLLKQLDSDVDARKRLAPVVLGQRPGEPNAVFPQAALSVLMQAKQAIAVKRAPTPFPEIPAWLTRIQKPQRRRALFIAGAGLVLVAIRWFGLASKRQGQRGG